MQTQNTSPKNILQLFTIGLITGIVFAFLEIKTLWAPDQIWNKLLTPIGTATIVAYFLLAFGGITILFLSFWNPRPVQSIANQLVATQKLAFLWLIAFSLIGFVTWVYLFSPWQKTLTMPWSQFIFAAALARMVTWIFVPKQSHSFGWSELVLTFSVFLYPRVVQEVRILYPAALFTRGVLASGFIFQLGLIYILYQPFGKSLYVKLLGIRSRFAGACVISADLFLLTPFIHRYVVGASEYIQYPNLRFAILLISLSIAAYLLCGEASRLVTLESVIVSTGWLVLVSALTRSLLLVVNNPFGLYWSEGNRMYDYSLVFGQNLYNYIGRIPDPYKTPGRYGLWGVLYLWRDLPIWAHRLWNIVLLTLPSCVLAWALTRKLASSFLRKSLFLWIAVFFIVLAPLHPPFMVVAIIVALFVFHPSPYVRGGSLIIASLYAGVSRWTWVFAPGAWGALTDLLLYYPRRKGNWFKSLLPAVLMAVLGTVPGFLLNSRNFFGYTSGEVTTAQQPLLWYRLLPNLTLGPGIVFLMLLITGPLVALLLYKISSHQWKLDSFQLIAIWGALIGFLGAGLVISTKIGGGGDLHNLDMYIGTLLVVIMLGLTAQTQSMDVIRWPTWTLIMLCVLAILPVYQFTPFFSSANYHASLELPTREDTNKALGAINDAVDRYSRLGEVLFMDQRQLLTFGYVKPIPFVPDYEKKYMMDQALASNEEYFRLYYQELANKRFSLIVTEPLREGLKDSGPFSEENDLWVKWVSMPTLCFYEPIMTDKTVGVQLLVPYHNTLDCEKYIK